MVGFSSEGVNKSGEYISSFSVKEEIYYLFTNLHYREIIDSLEVCNKFFCLNIESKIFFILIFKLIYS